MTDAIAPAQAAASAPDTAELVAIPRQARSGPLTAESCCEHRQRRARTGSMWRTR